MSEAVSKCKGGRHTDACNARHELEQESRAYRNSLRGPAKQRVIRERAHSRSRKGPKLTLPNAIRSARGPAKPWLSDLSDEERDKRLAAAKEQRRLARNRRKRAARRSK